MAFASQEHVYR